jgi:SAM-dependent methyltransferase
MDKTITGCCEACGDRELSVILDDLSHEYNLDGHRSVWRYRLIECAQCGLGFVDPKPEWAVLRTFYDHSYGPYLPAEPEAKSIKYWIAKQRYALDGSVTLAALLSTGFAMLCEWLTGKTVSFTLGVPLRLCKDAHIFELGYGSGSWLLGMSSLGYTNLHGYDIESNSLDQSRLLAEGISLSGGDFIENDYPEEFFDCICLEHVFEHLLSPVKVIAKCRKMLKVGGYLLINTPCKVSWSVRLSLRHFAALDIPRHLFHYTPKSAELILNAAGLSVLKIKPYGVAAVLGVTLNGLLRERGKLTVPAFFFPILSPPYALFSKITNRGDAMTILAKRTE